MAFNDEEMGLKLMKIENPMNKIGELIFYRKLPKDNSKTQMLEEIMYITNRYRFMNLKVQQRQPLSSRVDFHKWLVTKDRYGNYYMMLIHEEIFEELFLFKM